MNDVPRLQRPGFFDGQQLEAVDLNSAQAFHRELRFLHQRSLHNWGIVFGLDVAGKRKQRSVTVQSGYALDCQGRELILAETLDVPVPPVAADAEGKAAVYYLTISYLADEDIVPQTRAGPCDLSGAVRRPEGGLIRWQDPDEGFRFGLDVVLASIQVKDCRLAADVSGAVRRDAVPEQQPYIAAGQTTPGETDWRLWPNDDQPLGIAATVNTTSAGFRATPRYQAHIIGNRIFNADIIIDGFQQIAQPGPFSFDIIMLLPQLSLPGGRVLNIEGVIDNALVKRLSSSSSSGEDEGLGWYVVWMGQEG